MNGSSLSFGVGVVVCALDVDDDVDDDDNDASSLSGGLVYNGNEDCLRMSCRGIGANCNEDSGEM